MSQTKSHRLFKQSIGSKRNKVQTLTYGFSSRRCFVFLTSIDADVIFVAVVVTGN